MKIEWSGPSQKDLLEIQEFIASDSPSDAQRFVSELIRSADPLRKFPRLGRILPEKALHNYREIIFRDYRIIYRVTDTSILIARVVHGRRLLKLAWKPWGKS